MLYANLLEFVVAKSLPSELDVLMAYIGQYSSIRMQTSLIVTLTLCCLRELALTRLGHYTALDILENEYVLYPGARLVLAQAQIRLNDVLL